MSDTFNNKLHVEDLMADPTIQAEMNAMCDIWRNEAIEMMDRDTSWEVGRDE